VKITIEGGPGKQLEESRAQKKRLLHTQESGEREPSKGIGKGIEQTKTEVRRGGVGNGFGKEGSAQKHDKDGKFLERDEG